MTKEQKDNSLDGKFMHIKIGDKENPASETEIIDMQKKLVKLFEKNNVDCVTLVTHHATEINIV